jgi:hypothetical protein
MSWQVFVPSDVGGREGGTRESLADDASVAGERAGATFAAALAVAGVRATIEVRARLAVVHLADGHGAALEDVMLRRRVVALGRDAGFTHVAVAVGEG